MRRFLAAAVGVALLAPASAPAATVSAQGAVVRFAAGAGEANTVQVGAVAAC